MFKTPLSRIAFIIVLIIIWAFAANIYTCYFQEFNGKVIKKYKELPKETELLILSENKEPFPLYYWDRSLYDSIKIGDSILKRKYDPKVYYYKRVNDYTFREIILK